MNPPATSWYVSPFFFRTNDSKVSFTRSVTRISFEPSPSMSMA